MKLAYHLEIARPEFARHVSFLKDCGVEDVPIFFMLNPEDYQPALGEDMDFGGMLALLDSRIGEVRGQGLESSALMLFPGRALTTRMTSDPEMEARFRSLCEWCGEQGVRSFGVWPQVQGREDATPEWLDTFVAGAQLMAGLAAPHGVSIGVHINMLAGCRLDRVEDVEDLFARVDRPNWGLNFCFGCLALAGLDLAEMARRWAQHIVLVDLRDVRGTWTEGAEEAQFGTGRIDLPAALRALREIGYTGGLRPEHFPPLGLDRPSAERELFNLPADRDPANIAWTLGYCCGLLRALD